MLAAVRIFADSFVCFVEKTKNTKETHRWN